MFCLIQNWMVNTNHTFKDVFPIREKKGVRGHIKKLHLSPHKRASKNTYNLFKNMTAEI